MPAKLAPGTLLMTNWPMFDLTWKQFPGSGAVRFTSLDEASLIAWDPTLKTADISKLLENVRPHLSGTQFAEYRSQTLQSFGDSLLNRLAPSRLFALPSVETYPLLWSSKEIWPYEIPLETLFPE
jgi:hypothetical protein